MQAKPKTTTKKYCIDLQDAYWKWHLYVLPLNDFQVRRNLSHAKAFYNIHTDLLDIWKAMFIEKLNLTQEQRDIIMELSI